MTLAEEMFRKREIGCFIDWDARQQQRKASTSKTPRTTLEKKDRDC
jgi:hypothetical protein